MSMFSDVLRLLKALNKDIANLLDPYPKKRRPSTWTPDDEPIQRDSSSYEQWDFLTKEQWQEIYDGKKSLQDYLIEPHVWPPQMDKEKAINDEQKDEETERDSADTESDEGISDEETSEDNSGNAEQSESESDDSIDSYENSVSEPDFDGSVAFESNSEGNSGSESESEV